MVLVHKLKQMEAIDIEQFRDRPTQGSSSDVPTQHELAVSHQKQISQPAKKRTGSPPRRPTTRSQTGHVAKRRGGDYGIFEKQNPSTSKSPPAESHLQEKLVDLLQRDILPADSSLSPNTPPVVQEQYTFLGESPPVLDYDRRGPKSRATLPVPVPNLTKKSRGRRVPTKSVSLPEGVQKPTRLYACPVPNCLKCFNRGEHLKRHIRSIHTNEKPFACSYPSCDKFFNRHDNLLQHLKVHKDFSPQPADSDIAALQHQSPHNAPSDPDPYSSPLSTTIMLPPTYTTFTSYHTPSMGFTTNMAVSSLRTQLPHSPTADSSACAVHDSPTGPRPHYRPQYESDGHSPPLLIPSIPQHDWQA